MASRSGFLIEPGRGGVMENRKFLEGKIKAVSRGPSYVIVCTSFFGETQLMSRETDARKVVDYRGYRETAS
jgi:hypothetical protein